jgi:tRNA nucleotidyltransferase (CCA-adding enzyme)
MERAQTPHRVNQIARLVREIGGRAMLVGGCVRDRLMNRPIKDWDLEVYGVEPAKLRSLLEQMGRVDAVGEAFTVYKLGQHLDVSIPRREHKHGRGHRGFVIEGDPHMSIESATRRRDFTINAILEDPLTGEVVDPHEGQRDIARGLLRAVASDTFIEDSLRVLRAAQFAARFGFEIQPETRELCRQMDLSDLPRERIWGEMEKLLLDAGEPSVGLIELRRLAVVDQLFPEIKALIDVPQEPEWHPEGDVFIHTALTVDRAREQIFDLDYPRKVTVMLAALCHDFGKPPTTEFLEGRWRSRGHEEAGIAPTESFLERLNIHSIDGYDVRAQVIALVRDHLRPGEFFKKKDQVGDGAFRKLSRRCELELLYRVAKADSLGRNAPWVPTDKWFDAAAQEWFIEKARNLNVEKQPPQSILMGRHLIDLGMKPGPQMGAILAEIYDLQLEGKVTNLDEAIGEAKARIAEQRSLQDGIV